MIIHNPILTGSFTVNGTDVASITSSAASITALNAYTASQDILNGTYTLTSSFAAQTASFTAFTSSVNTFTASQLVLNGTYATTGSNTFTGIQTVNSNLIVTGSITAQTLVVQTVTSSVVYSSGSNVFGNNIANTQTFTGSMNLTGSLTVNGTSSIVGTGTTNYLPKFTGTSTIGNSLVVDNGTNIGIGTTNPTAGRLQINVSDTTTAAHFQIVDGTTTLANSFVTNFRNANDGDGRYSLSRWQVQNAVGNDQIGFIGVQSITGAGTYTPNIVFGQRTGVSTYATRMTLDSSGNLGLGVTPSAWDTTTFKGIQIAPSNAFIVGRVDNVANQLQVGSNAYYNADGNWKFIQNGYATRYIQNGGTHAWDCSNASGTAGNNVTFITPLTITVTGNVGIGITNPNYTLDVNKSVAGDFVARILNSSSTGYGLYIQTNDNSKPGIRIANASGATKIDLSGTGQATFNATDDGIGQYFWFTGNAAVNSNFSIYAYSNNVYINAYQTMVIRANQGTTGGSIQLSGGVVFVGGASITNSGSTMNVIGTSTSLPLSRFFVNVASSLSVPAARFDKYDNNTTTSQVFIDFTVNNQASGNGSITGNGASQVTFTTWSDIRLKENITNLPSQLSNIMALRPVEFDYKNGSGHQIGFIAQEVQEIYPDIVGENAEGYLTISGLSKMESRLIKAIQELQAQITELKNK